MGVAVVEVVMEADAVPVAVERGVVLPEAVMVRVVVMEKVVVAVMLVVIVEE